MRRMPEAPRSAGSAGPAWGSMQRMLDQLLAAPGLTRGRFALLAVVSLASPGVVWGAPRKAPGGGRLVAAAGSRRARVGGVPRRAPAPAASPAAAPAPAAITADAEPV